MDLSREAWENNYLATCSQLAPYVRTLPDGSTYLAADAPMDTQRVLSTLVEHGKRKGYTFTLPY